MQVFDVTVRNEITGETAVVSVETAGGSDAQVDALVRLFHSQGWRKATALQPVARSADEVIPDA